MDIQKLISVPYSDFKLNTTIDPEQFDINNQAVVNKIDEIIEATNANTNGLATHETSADHDARYYTKDQVNEYLRGGDTIIKEEVFTIVNSNIGDGTFTYTDKNGALQTGQLTADGYQQFTLLEGSYLTGSNAIEAIVGDTLHRSVASGGLVEVNTNIIILTDPVGNGTEVSFKYFQKIGVAGTGMILFAKIQPTIDVFWIEDITV